MVERTTAVHFLRSGAVALNEAAAIGALDVNNDLIFVLDVTAGEDLRLKAVNPVSFPGGAGGHSGTTGSVFFAGAGGVGSAPTEDNTNLFWDDVAKELGVGNNTPTDQLDVRGTNGGHLALTTSDTTVTGASNELGRIDFSAPLEASGTDAILVAASIYAEAEAAFDATTNSTSLVFATGASEVAAEKARLTSDGELGVGTNSPTAFLHVKRTIALEADHIMRVERTGTVAATPALYVGDGGSDADLLVTGDGRVGVNRDQATLNAQFLVHSVVGGPATGQAVHIIQDRTDEEALRIASAQTQNEVLEIVADSLTTGIGIGLSVDALTTGIGVSISSGSADASVRELLYVENTNAASTGCIPLQIEQRADNEAMRIRNGVLGSDTIFSVDFNGQVEISRGATPSPNGQLHVDQNSTTAAIPVLYLDQADISEEMIEFNTTIGTGNAIEAVGAKALTTTHFIKVTLPGGLTRYIPCGTIA
jgi:hypothetical protein